MAIEIKTLASGVLKLSNATFQKGERVLYAAPHPDEPFHPENPTAKKAAMITGMRFFNSHSTLNLSIALQFVRYDGSSLPARRRPINALPYPTLLNRGELRVETTPLVLEEGDLIVGFVSTVPNGMNWIHYVISGIEREV